MAKTTRYLLAVHVLIPLWYLVHRKHRLLEMQASSSSCARLAPGVVAVCGCEVSDTCGTRLHKETESLVRLPHLVVVSEDLRARISGTTT